VGIQTNERREMNNPNFPAVITAVREHTSHGLSTVYGKVDGEEQMLFSYFIDELHINPQNLLGLTPVEAVEYWQQLDAAYLRT
jgi:hypothetical protein